MQRDLNRPEKQAEEAPLKFNKDKDSLSPGTEQPCEAAQAENWLVRRQLCRGGAGSDGGWQVEHEQQVHPCSKAEPPQTAPS